MEVFPSLKTQNSRIPLSYNAYCSTHSKRKAFFNCRSNFNSWSSFRGIKGRRLGLCSSYNEAGSITQPGLENMPLSVELEPISSESQFDRVVAEAQQLEESVVVLWMASWCRKCIYLKPKLEKLAADYYPRIRFYSVDVNNVPHKLVVRAGVTSELEALLLQQQRNRGLILEKERELDINRSGSAPPTVEGALGAAGSLFRYPNFSKNDGGGGSNNNIASIGVLSEEEIRAHPAYLEYYYSHENLNPRLPPPSLSKEDWRVAQRVRASGFGLGRNANNSAGSSSLFSMQPGLSVKKAEDEMMELRKTALRNLSRKNSTESLDKGSSGLVGASSSGMGVRRKSFADILQEGLGRPVKSHLSRAASQNSVTDVLDSMVLSNSNAVVAPQNIGSANPSSFGSSVSSSFTSTRTEPVGRSRGPGLVNLGNGVHRAGNLNSMTSDPPNFPSSGIFEIADIAASLSGLSMSRGQLHADNISKPSFQMGIPTGHKQNQQQYYGDSSRAENLINNINYVNLARTNASTSGLNTSKSVPSEQVSIPRRTSSTANLLALHNSSDYARLEDLKIQYQNNNFPGVALSAHRHGGYAVDQKPDMMINTDLGADGQLLRSSSQAGLHYPVMDPHQIQYMQKMLNYGRDLTHIAGNSSQGIHCVGSSHSNEDFQALEKAYLEALLVQQLQHYQSQFLQKPGSINHQYPGNPAFGSCAASYQGNLVLNAPISRVSSRGSMLQNEKSGQMPTTLRSVKGESSGPLNSQSGKGRFESLLEVLKNNKTKSLELTDIIGHIVEFSMDQFGSRFIQQKLETATVDEKAKILSEIIPHARGLMIDVFGNYVIQKFFEHGTESQRKELAGHLIGHVLPLTLQMYGCRVVQKHVVQHGKPHERSTIIGKLAGQIVKMSQQKFASNVVEKCLTFGGPEERKLLVNEMLGTTDENEPLQAMMKDPFGNYVVQKVLETCDEKSRELILSRIKVHLSALKRYTYGKTLEAHRANLLQFLLKHSNLKQKRLYIHEDAESITATSSSQHGCYSL
ncbi:Pumilio4 [Sesamum angolense]|uniref:Pumilio4 n=1 Tax=Sesamum angolense TaxID=2727404 RepID=A0AAE1X230_9LAMI|nr:Pumilio4 [Sesamum angolense]